MLQILHKGIQFNAPLDQTQLTGNVQADSTSAYILGLVAGTAVALGANGLKLADGATDKFLGFLINDAGGYFFENKPALASGLAPVTIGKYVVVTDQIDTTKTFNLGDLLYLGQGANKGKLTNVLPGSGNTEVIGIAGSAASAASPSLTVIRN